MEISPRTSPRKDSPTKLNRGMLFAFKKVANLKKYTDNFQLEENKNDEKTSLERVEKDNEEVSKKVSPLDLIGKGYNQEKLLDQRKGRVKKAGKKLPSRGHKTPGKNETEIVRVSPRESVSSNTGGYSPRKIAGMGPQMILPPIKGAFNLKPTKKKTGIIVIPTKKNN